MCVESKMKTRVDWRKIKKMLFNLTCLWILLVLTNCSKENIRFKNMIIFVNLQVFLTHNCPHKTTISFCLLLIFRLLADVILCPFSLGHSFTLVVILWVLVDSIDEHCQPLKYIFASIFFIKSTERWKS